MQLNEGTWKYRGWLVVLLGAAGMVATLPGRTVGLGLITEPLLADLAITKTAYANLTFWATIIGATFSFACGPAIDRFGVRIVLPAITLLLAITTATMGATVSVSSLVVFLILSRGLGQSSLSTASVTAVGKWFATKLGMALGVFSALVALGFATVIPILGPAITVANWRNCWIGVGLAIATLAVAMFVLLPRPVSDVIERNGDQKDHAASTLREALRSPAFWIFTLSTALYYCIMSGLTLFYEAVIQELGFGQNVFITTMAAMMGAGLIGNFVYGWLTERFSVLVMLSMNLILLALVLFSFPWLTTPNRIVIHGGIYGVVGGAFAVLFFTGYGKAFGKSNLGKIQGVAQVIGVVASALGPKLLAETEAATGSFLPVFRWFGPIAIVMAAAAWFTRMPSGATKPAPRDSA